MMIRVWPLLTSACVTHRMRRQSASHTRRNVVTTRVLALISNIILFVISGGMTVSMVIARAHSIKPKDFEGSSRRTSTSPVTSSAKAACAMPCADPCIPPRHSLEVRPRSLLASAAAADARSTAQAARSRPSRSLRLSRSCSAGERGVTPIDRANRRRGLQGSDTGGAAPWSFMRSRRISASAGGSSPASDHALMTSSASCRALSLSFRSNARRAARA